jgi:hypothetical protein
MRLNEVLENLQNQNQNQNQMRDVAWNEVWGMAICALEHGFKV